MILNSWEDIFEEISKKDYFLSLMKFINEERSKYIIFPPQDEVFNAFKMTPFKNIKVVIFGQDPYPNVNQAMGLSFSVKEGVKIPPSLKNIFKEIDIEFNKSTLHFDGDLTYLAKQGVLLLNPILTVREKAPLSHDNELYRLLFKDIVHYIEENDNHIVYLLWGNKASKYAKYITNKNHLVIKTNHPSPLSANRGGWFNSNCFIKCNEFLNENNIEPIDWIKK